MSEQARAALYYQIVSTYHAEKYDEMKKAFFGLIANSEDVTLEVAKSLRFQDGLVRWQSRANYEVDREAVVEAVRKGKLALETLLACVSRFNQEALAALVPEAVKEGKPTEFGVMQANPEYKQAVIARIEEQDRQLAAMQAEEMSLVGPR